jgi:hypothetical protein
MADDEPQTPRDSSREPKRSRQGVSGKTPTKLQQPPERRQLKFAHYSNDFLDLDGVSRLDGDGRPLRVYFLGLDGGDDAATCDANDISF